MILKAYFDFLHKLLMKKRPEEVVSFRPDI
jgi:hypothetical protein